MLAAWEHPDRIAPVRVLRVILRGPVTLGHALLLDELGSPIVYGEEFHMGDLALAVLVCSEPTASRARATIRAWWSGPLLRMWGRRCGLMDMAAESERFVKWFSEQCGGPEQKTIIRDGQAPPQPLSAPWYISKLASAVGELGMSIADAEAMPVKRLNQITAALAEARGNAQFLRDDEAQFFENVKHWDAEAAKGN